MNSVGTLAHLEHIALGIISITCSETLCRPLLRFGRHLSAERGSLLARGFNRIHRDTDLDGCFLANRGRDADDDALGNAFRNAMNHELKSLFVEHDLVLVAVDFGHLGHFAVELG